MCNIARIAIPLVVFNRFIQRAITDPVLGNLTGGAVLIRGQAIPTQELAVRTNIAKVGIHPTGEISINRIWIVT